MTNSKREADPTWMLQWLDRIHSAMPLLGLAYEFDSGPFQASSTCRLLVGLRQSALEALERAESTNEAFAAFRNLALKIVDHVPEKPSSNLAYTIVSLGLFDREILAATDSCPAWRRIMGAAEAPPAKPTSSLAVTPDQMAALKAIKSTPDMIDKQVHSALQKAGHAVRRSARTEGRRRESMKLSSVRRYILNPLRERGLIQRTKPRSGGWIITSHGLAVLSGAMPS